MTHTEVLDELERLFIITRIGSEYFISQDIIERASRHDTEIPIAEKIPKTEYEEILDKPEDPTRWPYQIKETKGRARVEAFMNLAKVPHRVKNGYRVRGLDKDCIIAIDRLVERNPNMRVDILFSEVEFYYKSTEYPKAFKNFVKEGDMLDIYNEAIERLKENKTRIDPNSNTTWG